MIFVKSFVIQLILSNVSNKMLRIQIPPLMIDIFMSSRKNWSKNKYLYILLYWLIL